MLCGQNSNHSSVSLFCVKAFAVSHTVFQFHESDTSSRPWQADAESIGGSGIHGVCPPDMGLWVMRQSSIFSIGQNWCFAAGSLGLSRSTVLIWHESKSFFDVARNEAAAICRSDIGVAEYDAVHANVSPKKWGILFSQVFFIQTHVLQPLKKQRLDVFRYILRCAKVDV